jgi:hypothetical protein
MHSKNFDDLKGRRFGKLVAIQTANKTKSGNWKWICQCDCGNMINVNGSKLKSGHTKSCGCLKTSQKGLSQTRIYHIWRGMIARCENYLNDNYYWYGLKGISVCDEWYDFQIFHNWALESGYEQGLTIDRIDSNDNYYPENCRWVSQKRQCNNVSSNRFVLFKNKRYTIAEFAEFLGYKYWTVSNRIRLGWAPEKIASVTEVSNGR